MAEIVLGVVLVLAGIVVSAVCLMAAAMNPTPDFRRVVPLPAALAGPALVILGLVLLFFG